MNKYIKVKEQMKYQMQGQVSWKKMQGLEPHKLFP